MKGIGSGKSRVAKVRAAEGQCGKPPGGLRPGGQKAKSREIKSFVLRTYIVGGMGVKKLHIDWLVKVVSVFPGRCDCPNVGLYRDLLA